MASPIVRYLLEMWDDKVTSDRELARRAIEDQRRRQREDREAQFAEAAAARLAKGAALSELLAGRAADVASVGALESESMTPFFAAGQDPIGLPGGGPPGPEDVEARLTATLGPTLGPALAARVLAGREPQASSPFGL